MKTKDTTHYEQEFLSNSRAIRDIDNMIERYEDEQEHLHGIKKIASTLNLQELHFKRKRITKRNRKLQRILKYTPLDLWIPITLPDQKTIDNAKEYKLAVPESFWEKQDLLHLENEIDQLDDRKAELLKTIYSTPTGIADQKTQEALDELTRTEALLVLKAYDLRLSIEASHNMAKHETISSELQSIRHEQDAPKSKESIFQKNETAEEKTFSELQYIRNEIQMHGRNQEHTRV